MNPKDDEIASWAARDWSHLSRQLFVGSYVKQNLAARRSCEIYYAGGKVVESKTASISGEDSLNVARAEAGLAVPIKVTRPAEAKIHFLKSLQAYDQSPAKQSIEAWGIQFQLASPDGRDYAVL